MLLVMNLYMGVRQTNFPMYLNFSDMASGKWKSLSTSRDRQIYMLWQGLEQVFIGWLFFAFLYRY